MPQQQQSSGQKKTVHRVMKEYKDGTLESGSGGKVKSRKQAIAIAMSEAGMSNRQTKAALYAQAKKKNIKGRSTMTKAQLSKALGH